MGFTQHLLQAEFRDPAGAERRMHPARQDHGHGSGVGFPARAEA